MVTPVDVVSSPVTSFQQALTIFVGVLLKDTSHILALPYERKKAETMQLDPIVAISVVGLFGDDADARSEVDPVFAMEFVVSVRQKLMDHKDAGYTNPTYDRLWDIADFLAGRLHNAWLFNRQIGVVKILEVMPSEPEVQDLEDREDINIRCAVRLHLDSLRDIQTTEGYRTGAPYEPDPDAPFIDTITFTMRDGRQNEIAKIQVLAE